MKSGHGIANTFSDMHKGNDHPHSKDLCVLLRPRLASCTRPMVLHVARSQPQHTRILGYPHAHGCSHACAVLGPLAMLRVWVHDVWVVSDGDECALHPRWCGGCGAASSVRGTSCARRARSACAHRMRALCLSAARGALLEASARSMAETLATACSADALALLLA